MFAPTGPSRRREGCRFEDRKEDRKGSSVAYVITDKCTMCGTCIESCPVEAISEGDPKYVINPDECVDCGTCEAECSSEAIEPGE